MPEIPHISQIMKYCSGELDEKAMHQLEREALDDPFLADAMDGFEGTPKDQQPNLVILHERMQQRVLQKNSRSIPWQNWLIAASVITILTIGGLWITKDPDTRKPLITQVKIDKAKVELKDTVSATTPTSGILNALMPGKSTNKKAIIKPANNSVYQQELAANDNKVPLKSKEIKAADPVILENKKEASPIGDLVVMNYTKDKKNNPDSIASSLKKPKDKDDMMQETALQSRAAGVQTEPGKDSRSQFLNSRIAGTIISKDDGSPIIGAAIRIKGTNKTTVSDVRGNFSMSATGNKETLNIGYIGYQPKQINVTSGDTVRVELSNANSSLSEVAVVGYRSKKNSDDGDDRTSVKAHPQMGWHQFKKFVQTNALLPAGEITGNVNLSFIVNGDGSLSDFKIVKSLSPVADIKAIDIVKNGSTWIGNSNGKQETVTMKVKF